MRIRISKRELATVLAALRYWQQDLNENDEEDIMAGVHFDEVNTPLSIIEIDELCGRLNVEADVR